MAALRLSYKLMLRRRAMPRGNIPRQPSKAGRHDRVQRPVPAKLAGTRPPTRLDSAKGLNQKPSPTNAPVKGTGIPKGYKPLAPERVNEILKRLDQRYPNVVCALQHNSAWELLVATILSAQCTDARVNMVTPV